MHKSSFPANHTIVITELPSTKKPGLLHHRPLLYYQSKSDDSPERVIFQFSRRSFSGFGTHSQVDLLTPLQVEALDALHFLAERFQLAMTLQKGDMQFINNLSIFHARRSYLDDAEHRWGCQVEMTVPTLAN